MAQGARADVATRVERHEPHGMLTPTSIEKCGMQFGGHARMPEADQQHHPVLVTPVPNLMLKAVVEDQTSPLLPWTSLLGNADLATVRDDEAKVAGEARVRGATMRPEMRARAKHRKVALT